MSRDALVVITDQQDAQAFHVPLPSRSLQKSTGLHYALRRPFVVMIVSAGKRVLSKVFPAHEEVEAVLEHG
jgi:hypothetical protein